MDDIFPPASGILSYTGLMLKFMKFEIVKQGLNTHFIIEKLLAREREIAP